MKHRLLGLVFGLTALAASGQVPVLAGKPWESLSAEQRSVLAPLAGQWSQMDAGSRDTWAAVARRYPAMDTVEQQRLRERMRDWAALSPAERQRVHDGFVAAQRVSPEQRQLKWEQYQALSAEQRQALQDRAIRRQAEAASAPAPTGSAPLRDSQRTVSRAALLQQLDERTLLPRRTAP